MWEEQSRRFSASSSLDLIICCHLQVRGAGGRKSFYRPRYGRATAHPQEGQARSTSSTDLPVKGGAHAVKMPNKTPRSPTLPVNNPFP